MEQEKVSALLAENLKTVFAYSLSRLHNRQEAEDLAGDIVAEVLKNGHRVREDDAFFGYMWSIANNTFKKHLRSKRAANVEFDEAFVGAYFEPGFDREEQQQEAMVLRRELSLLSAQYRQATVLYYIYNKSCADISSEMNVSPEMVKYYLFKTRKILKEGIGVTREFGEKSYNPGTFRMDYWGNGGNSEFWALFKRKLPGNILLSAYYIPQSISELSAELGVSAVYLEDEINILVQNEMLKQVGNGKLQTNIIIFTDAFEKELISKIKPICNKAAQDIAQKLKELTPQARKNDFTGRDYAENPFLWTLSTALMFFAQNLADEKARGKYGDYPLLANGSHGFVYGYDNDYTNHHYNGIYGRCINSDKTAYFTAYNFRVIQDSQYWKPKWVDTHEVVNAAVLGKRAPEDNETVIKMIEEGFISSSNGVLSANFPVYTEKQFDEMWELLKPLADELSECVLSICKTAGDLLKSHAPKALSGYCEQLASIKYEMDAVALIMEAMVAQGDLKPSDLGEKLAMYGVIL